MLPSLEDYTGLKKTMTSIHKTAIVSSNSKIDESVEIGAYDEVYTLSDVKVTGEFVIPKEEVEKFIFAKPGQTFSQGKDIWTRSRCSKGKRVG